MNTGVRVVFERLRLVPRELRKPALRDHKPAESLPGFTNCSTCSSVPDVGRKMACMNIHAKPRRRDGESLSEKRKSSQPKCALKNRLTQSAISIQIVARKGGMDLSCLDSFIAGDDIEQSGFPGVRIANQRQGEGMMMRRRGRRVMAGAHAQLSSRRAQWPG